MQFSNLQYGWLLLGAALCSGPGSSLRAENAASTDKIGKKIERVSFKDAAGKPLTLDDLKAKKAVVVVFLSFECPVSTSYAQVLTDLARTYGPRDVAFLGITTNDDETAAEVARLAAEFKLPFPVFKDEGRVAADAFKATTTPEAFVLDRFHILRYRGRIDNGYAARLKKNLQVSRHDLRQAVEEVLAEKPVTEPATLAIGCPIFHATAAKKTTAKVTYYKDVLPILQNHCQQCHRPGEVGPFALMTYRHAVNWAGDIKEYTQSRQMPPWKPVAGPAFQNERKLSDHDIATLAAWVDGGTPAGDPKDAPPPRKFVQGWQLGEPDLVLTIPEDFQVAPSGRDIFRCFVLPTNLPEDKYVVAVDIRPSNPRVVHHVLVFVDNSGKARQLEQKAQANEKPTPEGDGGPGYSSAMGIGFLPRGGLGGWAPGQMARYLPEGSGHLLPKGADVVLQVHYHRDGRLEKDRTRIGLYLARKPVTKPFQSIVVGGGRGRNVFFTIPAGAAHHRVTGSIVIDSDCTIYHVLPHMHLIGKEINVTMTPPAGTPQTLVAINDWNYNWQETYVFKQPIAVKAGTRFDIEAFYDNSDQNPNNPNHPPKIVFFGEQTTNEMCFGFIGATSDQPGRIRRRVEDPIKQAAKDKPMK
jgi:peroxiredoxin